MSQLLVTPSSLKNLVSDEGVPARNFQFWMAAVTVNVNQLLQAQVPHGASVLWPAAVAIPAGWVDTGDTGVIGAHSYRVIIRP